MSGRIVVDIVSGASQGIGKAIAESIAHHRKEGRQPALDDRYRLVLVGRNQERGNQAASFIQNETGANTTFEVCDVSDFASVMKLRNKILPRDATVGILVNNAAECPQRQHFVHIPRKKNSKSTTRTMEKVDKQFAINVLGYHFMLTAFSSAFAEGTHVVNVASNWAGDLDLTDLSFQRRRYDNDSAYRQSKQCDRMLSVAWAERVATNNVTASSRSIF